ncbi:hypothetical protein DPMN_155994 [Dreissena polymorpha]|uniref:Uncharacterized protein n=1 Tax=Dreissena polymorpha TaxID=45954 RepID=A0A9D4FRF7_DREPO|nr:hypothetical protein DPMN_155994 [Dreissena polymorpha]
MSLVSDGGLRTLPCFGVSRSVSVDIGFTHVVDPSFVVDGRFVNSLHSIEALIVGP